MQLHMVPQMHNKNSNTYPRTLTLLKVTAPVLPSCLQAVFALSMVKLSIQMVLQTLFMKISNLPNGGS